MWTEMYCEEDAMQDKLELLANKLDALELIKSYEEYYDIIRDMFYDDYIVPFREFTASYDEIDNLIDNTKHKIKELTLLIDTLNNSKLPFN